MRILLAEDNPMAVSAIKDYLKIHTVDAFSTAEKAITKFEHTHFDAAIVDINLLESSGLDVIDYMLSKCNKIIIVATSGYITPILKRDLHEKGIPLLEKPFLMSALGKELKL